MSQARGFYEMYVVWVDSCRGSGPSVWRFETCCFRLAPRNGKCRPVGIQPSCSDCLAYK
jgi:hypothetical protein